MAATNSASWRLYGPRNPPGSCDMDRDNFEGSERSGWGSSGPRRALTPDPSIRSPALQFSCRCAWAPSTNGLFGVRMGHRCGLMVRFNLCC